jgi:hypothetical protein
MYYGNGTFASGNTAFFVGKNSGGQANFSLGNKLTWDGATLSITGNVVITGGSTLALINDAQADADAAAAAASNAYDLADNAIPAGFAAADINTYSTTIDGGKITTGSINADRIVAGSIEATQIAASYVYAGAISANQINAGTLTADRIFGGTISSSSIDVDFDIKCGTGTLRVGSNRGLQSDGQFSTTTSTTTCRVHAFGSYGSEVFRAPASRRELKENIEDISGATEILKKLRPRKFNWKIDAHDPMDPITGRPWTDEAKAINEFNKAFGFIAEEVAEDYPALALYNSPKHLPSEDPESYFDIASWVPAMWKDMDMVPLLVKAIQELSARIEELESRLNS